MGGRVRGEWAWVILDKIACIVEAAQQHTKSPCARALAAAMHAAMHLTSSVLRHQHSTKGASKTTANTREQAGIRATKAHMCGTPISTSTPPTHTHSTPTHLQRPPARCSCGSPCAHALPCRQQRQQGQGLLLWSCCGGCACLRQSCWHLGCCWQRQQQHLWLPSGAPVWGWPLGRGQHC
jgi:hypothetical protein